MKFLLTILSLFTAMVFAVSSEELQRALAKSSGNVIKLTKGNFERLLGGPREDYIVLLLTATNPQVGCQVCINIHPEFDKLADSWVADHPNGDGLYFARADLADGNPEIFQAFQLNSVPKMYLYSPSDQLVTFNSDFDIMNIPQSEPLAQYVSDGLDNLIHKKIVIREPPQYGSAIVTFIAVFAAVYVLKKQTGLVKSVLTSRPLWGIVIVLSVLLFTTGYMFNSIRNMPFFMPTREGGVQYFMNGQQTQLGAETQVMSFVYGMLALSVVCLITKVPLLTRNSTRLAVVIYLLAVNLALYSILMSIFKFKSSGYPFQLFNIWSP